MVTLILIAFSLAMDCFAVSIAGGALDRKFLFRNALKIALSFGIFQALMPLIGWLIGQGFSRMIAAYDHWVAFSLLLAIGVKMIYEAFRGGPDNRKDIFRLHTLLVLSVATSIDALVVGITLALLNTPVVVSITVIGVFAFIFSIAGYYIGHRAGTLFKNNAEILGGLILIGIGIKVLVEHLA
ncbi:MAG: manganese efflux pump MntP family protein [Actinomycetota bacterium]